jgi:hypothetical protein
VQEAFRLTGTSHIIVISGFNITISAWIFTLLFCRLLGKRKGAIVAAIGIIFYTLLVGANPAAVCEPLRGTVQNSRNELTADGTQMWVQAEKHFAAFSCSRVEKPDCQSSFIRVHCMK